MSWSHRDRVLAALNHEEPDRVPIDLGGTPTTTITVDAYDRLKDHLGLDHETRLMSKLNHLGLARRFDARTLRRRYPPGSGTGAGGGQEQGRMGR